VALAILGVDNTPVKESLCRKEAVYSGRVQGVGFRATVAFLARGYPVSGWVRNDASGSVTLQAQGESEGIEAFLDAVQARQASFIATTSVVDMPCQTAEAGFRIARSC
jgi:acylphosphatase